MNLRFVVYDFRFKEFRVPSEQNESQNEGPEQVILRITQLVRPFGNRQTAASGSQLDRYREDDNTNPDRCSCTAFDEVWLDIDAHGSGRVRVGSLNRSSALAISGKHGWHLRFGPCGTSPTLGWNTELGVLHLPLGN